MNDQTKSGGVLGEIRENLAGVFRHVLPGVIVVGAAHAAHPRWFQGFDAASWQHLTIAAVITLAAGNAWFVVNRYTVHQLVDYFAYLVGSSPTAAKRRWHYLETVAAHVKTSVMTEKMPDRARTHVAFRASSVLLLYTLAEVGLLFGFYAESETFFARNARPIQVVSALMFAMAVWQNAITRRIDYAIVQASQ